SLGTLVIEAGERSGSLITANFALDQGRGVFAVAGDIINSSFTGAHKLIRDGAKPVFSALDVLDEYKDIYPGALDLSALASLSSVKKVNAKVDGGRVEKALSNKSQAPASPRPVLRRKLPEGLGDIEHKVYEAVGVDPTHIDDIFRACKDSPPLIITALTQLELFGLIRLTDGKRYMLI
ncbi:MAG TPA: DNA-processing protein DprA, partial [Oscillospiraceae bacterium]|nr:DNA-processing protein DprA [Oscillospiraceae bacterium]